MISKMNQIVKNNILVVCPICGSSDYSILFYGHNRRDKIDYSGTYVQCKECSLVYLREGPRWEDIVRFYSVSDSDITANAGKIDYEELKQQINTAIPVWKQLLRRVWFRPHSWPLETVAQGSKRLLDLGCGNGAKLYEFAERGYEIWGVDVSIDSIKVCQKLLPLGHFIQSELHKINLPNAYFDYIRIDNTLEHVPDPRRLIAECYRLLKKGGRLLIYVPHGRSLSMRIMKGNSISCWIPFHPQLFTQKSLYRLLAEAEFGNVHIYGYYPNSWLPLSIMQWRMRKQKIPSLLYPGWLIIVCYPVGWVFSKIGLAEELIGVGLKN